MLQKFKMTTFAAVLGLFGFMLFAAEPVFAHKMLDDEFKSKFETCKNMKNNKKTLKRVMTCYEELAFHVPFNLDDKVIDQKKPRLENAASICFEGSQRKLLRCFKDHYGGLARLHFDRIKGW